MDKLKDFIDKNREAFENEALPEGHLERFMQKQRAGTNKRQVRIYTFWGAFAAAAVAALLLLLRMPGENEFFLVPAPEETEVRMCPAKQEIEELRWYYHMQMNEVIGRMRTISKRENTPAAFGLLEETKKILSDNYRFEETVLPTLPCSDHGLFAATQHYSNSLESLSIMLEQLERATKKRK